ncbi:hypothetical protein WA026_022739 [Henosepilachna vigintioctopunctata]|uniref:N-acetyltransferase 9-like protein n=1 Tax=Henosepilachna vigintioctopunctata TaxID=420089 RepID=A0AAW1UGK6_9CUCU
MRLNKDTKIIGTNVILVPYKEKHVLKYHNWMQSIELRNLTASEPLSLQEEYDMQRSWLIDEDKCTFIILDRATYETTKDEVFSMIGDVNLFFANSDDRLSAEAEIMIAEHSYRGKGRGSEAILHMFLYSIDFINVKQFIVKIQKSNKVSIEMFLKIGFTEIEESSVFNEITFVKVVGPAWIEWINKTIPIHEVLNENSEGLV